jgi:cytidine deaminase
MTIPWEALTRAAQEVQSRAYAPYSAYNVGSALYAEGQIFAGCNVENASFGVTVCAERHAVAAMVAAGARRIDAVVVTTSAGPPAAPCGVCRQALNEFIAGPSVEVRGVAPDGRQQSWTFGTLLPESFSGDALKR